MLETSFCANLKIHPSLYKRVPKVAPVKYPDCVIKPYEAFLDIPKIKEITKGDTIELSAVPYGPKGYGLEVKFIDETSKRTIIGGIYSSKGEANFSTNDLIFQTIQYIGTKMGLEQKPFERHTKYFQRVFAKCNEHVSN